MEEHERHEVVVALSREMAVFFIWVMDELGEEYALGETGQLSLVNEEEGRERIENRADSRRSRWWERDWYGFLDHTSRPSVYRILDAQDLLLVHYLEDLDCDHLRSLDLLEISIGDFESEDPRRFDDSFGVILASESLGWMYRLDFCERCGVVEVWSMEFSAEELVLYQETDDEPEEQGS